MFLKGLIILELLWVNLRLHSHLLYLAHGNEVLGHETFAMRIFYIRETVMELLNMIGGNRVQYGVSVIGGKQKQRLLLQLTFRQLHTNEL